MLVGHDRVVNFLKKVLRMKAGIHGFLFFGPDQVGKRTFALAFAKGLLCDVSEFGGCGACRNCKEFETLQGSHRDLFVATPNEEEPYGINQVSRQIKTFLSSRPQLSEKQVVIIDQADELTDEAQNALLKIFEEPPLDAVLILVSSKPSRIFETIRSRVVSVAFRLVNQKEMTAFVSAKAKRATHSPSDAEARKTDAEVRKIVKLSLGRPGRATRFITEPKEVKDAIKLLETLRTFPREKLPERFLFAKEISQRHAAVLPLWHLVIRDHILSQLGLEKLLVTDGVARPVMPLKDAIMLLRRAINASLTLENTNANPRLILENLLLTIP